MMRNSASFNNIMAALEYIGGLEGYPIHPVAGKNIFALLDNAQALDVARERYYGHDPESLRIFDWAARYRTVMAAYGTEAAKGLPGAPFSREEWARLEEKAQAMTSGFVECDYLLDRIDTWLLEAYALKGLCEAKPGDIVLDCGAYTGSTSLYFSQKVGPEGHVYGFEPVRGIFRQYEKNMAGLNNVTPVNAAVCDKKGILEIAEAGYGSSVKESTKAQYPCVKAYGYSIDAFVEDRAIERVDFIKMDIEGAEEAALHGAVNTIRRFKPRMALSAYHKEADLFYLPQIVEDIDASYKFMLRHFSDTIWETVLYCYMD